MDEFIIDIILYMMILKSRIEHLEEEVEKLKKKKKGRSDISGLTHFDHKGV